VQRGSHIHAGTDSHDYLGLTGGKDSKDDSAGCGKETHKPPDDGRMRTGQAKIPQETPNVSPFLAIASHLARHPDQSSHALSCMEH